MGILSKLFGRKPTESAPKPALSSPHASSDPRNDSNLIKVFDKYGRELFITREEWRTNVLPGSIESAWSDPDRLFSVILGALNDNFAADILAAAERLHQIDQVKARGACIYGIALMKNKKLDDAEQVLRGYLETYGDEGSVLTNLAKVYADRDNMGKAEEILWHALEVDPNQDNGLGWYEVMHRERSGKDAGLNALRRIAALPNSWRAQLWLARAALESNDIDTAVAYYQEGLARVGQNVPADLLYQMSGDLGLHGQLDLLLTFIEPHFETEKHGLQVGNNLIKANLESGRLEKAQLILDQLYAIKRPDWKETLSYWDTEIAKARLHMKDGQDSAPLEMTLLTVEGPIWLKSLSPAENLLLAKQPKAPTIVFLGCSAEQSTTSQNIERQLADAPGRVSRALPLFLAEQVQFLCGTRTKTLVPWITSGGGGFVLSGVAWNEKDMSQWSQQGDVAAEFGVLTHLKVQSEPWIIELRLVRISDGECIGAFDCAFNPNESSAAILQIARQLLNLLRDRVELEPESIFPLYQLPDPVWLPSYLLRLEQLLAVRCSAMDKTRANWLNGERDIIDGNIQLCLSCPSNIPVRLVLCQTALSMKEVKPLIVQEFAEKIRMLQAEHPLEGEVNKVARDVLDKALATIES